MKRHIAFMFAIALIAGPVLPITSSLPDVGVGNPPIQAEAERYIVAFTALPAVDRGGLYAGERVVDIIEGLEFLVVEVFNPPAFQARVLMDETVRYTERDNPELGVLFLVPNDSLYNDAGHWGSKKIGGEAAWDVTLGSTSVKVGMLDSGLYKAHEEFSGQTRVLQGFDFQNNDNDPNDESGCSWHGSHTTGTAGATINNAKGIAGMSQHTILPVKAFYPTFFGCSAGTTPLVNALKYMGDQGAHISSNSWGSSADSAALNDAVQYSHNLGVTHVAAAGNSGPCTNCVSYPWKTKSAITIVVSSTTSSDAQSSFSSEGPEVDVAAPGSSILSLCGTSTTCYQTISGTSMATPHVAGTAALVKAQNSGFTFTDLDNCLKNTALDLGPAGKDDDFGYGRIRADQAVNCGGPPPPPTVPGAPTLTATAGNAQVSLSWTTPSDGGSAITNYKVYKGTTSGGETLLTTLGVVNSYTDTAVTNGVTYYYQASAVNAVGEGARSNEVSATPSAPTCPGPANNCFANSQSVSTPSSTTVTTTGATVETGEPAPCGSIGATVWYHFVAGAAGTATIDTVGGSTNYDTVLAAYTGSTLTGLTNLACNDDFSALQSQISFTCTAGTTYRIQLGGYQGATGTATLDVNGCAANPTSHSENFDDGVANGWTLGGLWRISGACTSNEPSAPNVLNYNQAPSPCTYATGARTTGSAVVPGVDISGAASPTVTFSTAYIKENYAGGAFDIMRVQVQTAGSTSWTTLWQRDSRNADQTTWTSVSLSLTSYKSTATKVRFFFDSVDSTANGYLGWVVDNVVVQ